MKLFSFKWRLTFFLAFSAPFFLPAESKGVTRMEYGKESQQFGDLRLPKGKGPFPVIILIHGGCWLSDYNLDYLNPLAEWLTHQGFATWTIEYRRIGNPGGAWPGTFLDVGQAADFLRTVKMPLDLEHVYAAGHSAGGQLALWLASRGRIPSSGELFLKNPLKIRGVLGLAAITDLQTYRMGEAGSCHAAVDLLLGGTPETVPARYAQTSPLQLLPLPVPQVFIQGGRDPIVETSSVEAYVKAAGQSGDRIKIIMLPEAGHFEPVTPDAKTEDKLREAIQFLLKP